MKDKHTIVFCLSLLICANVAMAQDTKKVELGVFGGRTGSEGVDGMKFFLTPSFGFKATGRWTPTYINSEPAGIWCSPYYPWGCWVVGTPNYSHQGEISAGIVIRF